MQRINWLIDKDVCNKGSIWNPGSCDCECDKSCDVGEYLEKGNCKCKKKLIDKLVPECTENIAEGKTAETILATHKNVCACSYTVCVILAVIVSPISIGIGAYFAYSCWYLKQDVTGIKLDTPT